MQEENFCRRIGPIENSLYPPLAIINAAESAADWRSLCQDGIGNSSPHFPRALYCAGRSGHVYCVTVGRAPQQTCENGSPEPFVRFVAGRVWRPVLTCCALCIHARLRRIATKPSEKCGLVTFRPECFVFRFTNLFRRACHTKRIPRFAGVPAVQNHLMREGNPSVPGNELHQIILDIFRRV